ncbi:prepilin-type N-terminal cleavage/methylation domain-containing protein [Methylomicrobium sp. Wu6]|uniref:type IV pilus modification PilV family protein n=1 Tax=Methylomicrobium sp. Wu6 TaxID=3107928 RepID=UPI002DD65DBC|nr:prepilin-type N-terminal cleavage/methylation domain-containing protein [Methylomicrobium sp. Wu6]MEC4748781.1 prepilin-type N-terminal cleavage/methylation domain-containing protein [Methylomicrobium sp. Wu6]
MKPSQRKIQRGFSLLEILVAFSIMAIALGMLLSIFSSGLRNASVSEDYTTAVQIAEALMSGVGVETPLQQGQASGVKSEKYRWELTVSPFDLTTETIDTQNIPAQLFMVTVIVGWGEQHSRYGGERQFELTELKLSDKANEKP